MRLSRQCQAWLCPCPAPALPPVDRERCQAGERLAAALQVLFSTRTFLLLPREEELCVSAGPGGAWQGAVEAGRRVGEVRIFFLEGRSGAKPRWGRERGSMGLAVGQGRILEKLQRDGARPEKQHQGAQSTAGTKSWLFGQG